MASISCSSPHGKPKFGYAAWIIMPDGSQRGTTSDNREKFVRELIDAYIDGAKIEVNVSVHGAFERIHTTNIHPNKELQCAK